MTDPPDLSGATISLHTHRRSVDGPTYRTVILEFEDHEDALAAYQWLIRVGENEAARNASPQSEGQPNGTNQNPPSPPPQAP